MCSICGILDFNNPENVVPELTATMSQTMAMRGPDQNGSYNDLGVSFCHNRLAIIDVDHGLQPMMCSYHGNEYVIIYNGELYNTKELRAKLCASGVSLKTTCDTEIVLYSYILYGNDSVNKLNGIFAFAIYDKTMHRVFIARDRLGVKPFFYACLGTTFLFSSEIKALLQHPDISPVVDLTGFWQLLFLSPVRIPGETAFRDIMELKPGYCGTFSTSGLNISPYWEIKARPFSDSREDAIEKTHDLLMDAIKRQLISDVPLCTLLSGGLDSSIISAIAAAEYANHDQTLSTYSFEYEGNKENFHSSLFQPQGDDDYALMMADSIGSNHTVIQIPTKKVEQLLYNATLARDMPGQSDIDSSLLFFCQIIKQQHTVALSGECADEIFGGYPWFYRTEMLENPFFPWIHQPLMRPGLFHSSVNAKDGYEYLSQRYQDILKDCPVLDDDSPAMLQSRRATWLSVNLFMQSLLERKDRMSMAASVEVRVPFADHRILDYVYNIPWEIKFENNTEKALLRNAMKDILPSQILNRKKSPYPKTHNPKYELLTTQHLLKQLHSKDSILSEYIDKNQFNQFLAQESTTWFGQLMSKPQLLAWLLQFEYWLKEYHVILLL